MGTWLCLDCLTGSSWQELAVCGGVPEDGLVMGLSVLLEGQEMGDLAVLMVLEWGYLQVRMVLERVLCLCVGADVVSLAVRYVLVAVRYAVMFCHVLLSCSCEV